MIDSLLGLTSICSNPLYVGVYSAGCKEFYSAGTATPVQAGVFNGNTIAVVQAFNNITGFCGLSGCQVTAYGLECNNFVYSLIPAPNIETAYSIPMQMQFVFNGV
jgi:hypothetical protein